jgi:hydroxymethylpyrimidine pyrophosphatase-like HAD family hydrolase
LNQVSSPLKGLWLTDFDGTIKPGRDPVAPADLAALKRLGAAGWFRVVATGRSLFGFVKAWPPGLELDALIFASGAGLCAWGAMGPGPLMAARVFTPPEAVAVLQAARSLGYAFFAYHAPPDNHHFYYYRSAAAPLGFERRLEIFAVQASPWSDSFLADGPAETISQVLIMVPADQADQAEAVFASRAPGFSVVRSSSPFGDQHLWLEIFPAGVSKGRAAADLAKGLGLAPAQAVALGNDYNDGDLLAWAGRALVTSDARPELLALYPAIPPAGQGGLAWAAEKILAEDGHG